MFFLGRGSIFCTDPRCAKGRNLRPLKQQKQKREGATDFFLIPPLLYRSGGQCIALTPTSLKDETSVPPAPKPIQQTGQISYSSAPRSFKGWRVSAMQIC
ncbi:hypothetical protein CEF21_04460 [Bacillus sp. FJAT-42376]|nr:hypothetical protein CEF21_04460 [Bacillus sp. FJAT-42376]